MCSGPSLAPLPKNSVRSSAASTAGYGGRNESHAYASVRRSWSTISRCEVNVLPSAKLTQDSAQLTFYGLCPGAVSVWTITKSVTICEHFNVTIIPLWLCVTFSSYSLFLKYTLTRAMETQNMFLETSHCRDMGFVVRLHEHWTRFEKIGAKIFGYRAVAAENNSTSVNWIDLEWKEQSDSDCQVLTWTWQNKVV